MNQPRLILVGLFVVGTFAGSRLLFTAQAQNPPAAPTTETAAAGQNQPAGKAAIEAGVKKSTEEYVRAFNNHDAKAAAALFTPNAQYVGVDGQVIEGRQAIEKVLTDDFKLSPREKIEIQIESIQPLSQQSAVVQAVLRVSNPGEVALVETRYSALQVLDDGMWRAASVREWMPNPALAAAERQLEWFVGEWRATGVGGNINLTYAWDPAKTFLNGKYTITRDGKTVSTGTEILGRNPAGGLRSWTFDSTGIVSTGIWRLDGTNWIDDSTGTLPDGTTIESENILTPLGPNTFVWQTPMRSSGDVPLDPLPPIRVNRVVPNK